MKFILKKISYAKYDEFVEKIVDLFPDFDAEKLEKEYGSYTEEVMIGSKCVTLDLDIEGMINSINEILSTNPTNPMQEVDIKLAEMLYQRLYLDEFVPNYLFFEKEIWAYLNCFVLLEIVKARYFRTEKEQNDKGRVERVLLSNGALDRSGSRWLWVLANSTYDPKYRFALVDTAFKFIDPVKALFESVIGKNKTLFKAFIRAIELLDYDRRIRNNTFRSVLPTHLRNLATMKIYDSINSVEELAAIFATDIKDFLDCY